MAAKRARKRLVTKEDIKGIENIELERVRAVVQQEEAVAGFLRILADQTATNPSVHSEIVKSATLLRVFLENQISAARAQYPQAFEEKKDETTAV